MNYLILNNSIAFEVEGELFVLHKNDSVNVYLGNDLPTILRMMNVEIITPAGVIVLSNQYCMIAVRFSASAATYQGMKALDGFAVSADPQHSYTRAIWTSYTSKIDTRPKIDLHICPVCERVIEDEPFECDCCK